MSKKTSTSSGGNKVNPMIGSISQGVEVTDCRDTKTIVMYSPDVDLCMSFALYFQDRCAIVTTTDANTLPTLVENHRPLLVIVDALPTTWFLRLFDGWREGRPELRVMLFRVWRYEDRKREADIHKSIDFIVYKPIDMDFIAGVFNTLFEVPVEQVTPVKDSRMFSTNKLELS